jgi:DNA-binding transcriptional LysR family regulator
VEHLLAFVAAVEHGSFTSAARALDVPKSTISRRIQRLEEDVGQPLVVRHPRHFRLTDAGRDLYERVAPPLRDVAEATRAVRDGGHVVAGELRVTAPADFGTTALFVSMIVAFQVAHPNVALRLHLTDRVVDLVGEGFDVAFRAHGAPLPDRSSLIGRRLLRSAGGLYASAAYLDAQGRPRDAADLVGHRCFAREGVEGAAWSLRDAAGRELMVRSALIVDHFGFVRVAVERGLGIGLLPAFLGDGLASDGVERVLPDFATEGGNLTLLWAASRQDVPRIRAFVDHVTGRFRCEG